MSYLVTSLNKCFSICICINHRPDARTTSWCRSDVNLVDFMRQIFHHLPVLSHSLSSSSLMSKVVWVRSSDVMQNRYNFGKSLMDIHFLWDFWCVILTCEHGRVWVERWCGVSCDLILNSMVHASADIMQPQILVTQHTVKCQLQSHTRLEVSPPFLW